MHGTVVHLISGLGLGGAERQLQYLVTRSNSEYVRHVVISMTDKGALGSELEAQGVKVYALDMVRGRITWGGLFRLRDLLRTLKTDVLQTWMYHAGLLGLVAGGLAKVPSILWNLRCSNMDLSDYGRLTRLVVKVCGWMSSKPNVVVVNSRAGQRWHQQLGYHPQQWKLIYNGFDLDRFRPDQHAKQRLCNVLGIDEDSHLVGLVARNDPMKAHGDFIKAAVEISRTHPSAHFVLVGKDVDRIQGDGLKARLHALGPRDDIPALTAAFDVAVSASVYGEGFPNTVGEAMACGVPCVVTDVGDSAHIVGDLGWVVPPGDPSALAKAIGIVLDLNREDKASLSHRVREHIAALYGLDVMVTAYGNLYAQQIAEAQTQKGF